MAKQIEAETQESKATNAAPRVGWPIDYSGTPAEVLARLEAWQPPPDENDDADDWATALIALIEICQKTKAEFIGVFADWKQNPSGQRGPNGWQLLISFSEFVEDPRG